MSIVKRIEQTVAAAPLPRPLREEVEANLLDAVRKGFAVDLEQLCTNLNRLASVPSH